MNPDKTTTVIGIVKAVLYMGIAALVYFFQLPNEVADPLKTAVSGAQDWIALLLAVIAALQPIMGWFTNKKETKQETPAN